MWRKEGNMKNIKTMNKQRWNKQTNKGNNKNEQEKKSKKGREWTINNKINDKRKLIKMWKKQ